MFFRHTQHFFVFSFIVIIMDSKKSSFVIYVLAQVCENLDSSVSKAFQHFYWNFIHSLLFVVLHVLDYIEIVVCIHQGRRHINGNLDIMPPEFIYFLEEVFGARNEPVKFAQLDAVAINID